MAVLDENGLRYLWTKIKNTFVAQVEGKGLSANDYTTDEKNKLAGISTGATKNTVENVLTSTSTTNALSAAQGKVLDEKIRAINTGLEDLGAGDMLKSVYDTNGDGIVDNAEKVNGHTVGVDVPADAKFTDTTYGAFSTTKNGLVPKPSSAAVNQVMSSDGTWRELKMAFDPETLQVELGFRVPGTSTISKTLTATIPTATSTQEGLMKTAHYSKLEALPTSAELESTYAKKTDLTSLYKYKGSVADAGKLPTSGQAVGDVYDIQSASVYGGAGMNVAWNGTSWDALGEMFTITSIANSEIDAICV